MSDLTPGRIVSELQLLEVNNRDLDRRRDAERDVQIRDVQIGALSTWLRALLDEREVLMRMAFREDKAEGGSITMSDRDDLNLRQALQIAESQAAMAQMERCPDAAMEDIAKLLRVALSRLEARPQANTGSPAIPPGRVQRCDCVDSSGNPWPDCTCNHGWRYVRSPENPASDGGKIPAWAAPDVPLNAAKALGEQATPLVAACDKCGKPMSDAEGGKVFTVCDVCWPTPPVECPARKALERIKPHLKHREDYISEVCLDWCPLCVAEKALSTPYPPCPTCAELRQKAEDEKQIRIKYQDIVYAACNTLDRATGRRISNGLIAAKDDVVTCIQEIVAERDSLRKKVDRLVEFVRYVADPLATADKPIMRCCGRGPTQDDQGRKYTESEQASVDGWHRRACRRCRAAALLAEHDKEQGGKVEE